MITDTSKMKYSQLVDSSLTDITTPMFCQFFKYIRESHGYSQERLALLLKTDVRYLIGIENGRIWGNVNHINLERIEDVFGIKHGCLKKHLKKTILIEPNQKKA